MSSAPKSALGRHPTAESVRRQAEALGLGWAVLDPRQGASDWATVAVHLDTYQERYDGTHRRTALGSGAQITAVAGTWVLASGSDPVPYDPTVRFWSVEPVDHAEAEYWIGRVYGELGMPAPGFIWMPSPRACQRFLARSVQADDYAHYLFTMRYRERNRPVRPIHILRQLTVHTLGRAVEMGALEARPAEAIGAVGRALRAEVVPVPFHGDAGGGQDGDLGGATDLIRWEPSRHRDDFDEPDLFAPMAGRHDLDWLAAVLSRVLPLYVESIGLRLLVLTAIASYHASWWFPAERECVCSDGPMRWELGSAVGRRRRPRSSTTAPGSLTLHWTEDERYRISEGYMP